MVCVLRKVGCNTWKYNNCKTIPDSSNRRNAYMLKRNRFMRGVFAFAKFQQHPETWVNPSRMRSGACSEHLRIYWTNDLSSLSHRKTILRSTCCERSEASSFLSSPNHPREHAGHRILLQMDAESVSERLLELRRLAVDYFIVLSRCSVV